MITFPKYESYKDSGFVWLGEVPSDWDLQSIRAVTELKSDKNRPDLPVLAVYREYGIILKDSRDDNHNATALDISNYKVVEVGDLVINKMKAWQGSMGVSDYQGVVSPAYITCHTNSEKVEPRYLHYLLRSKPYVGVYDALSYGVRVGQWDMHYEDFKQIRIPIPSLEEQKRIVEFLDRKTAEIDEAIAHKQHLIELLQEQKAIFINQAVTKGLNPNVSMRESGVDWIGEVPEHWKLKRAKHLFKAIVDTEHKTAPSFEDGEYLIVRTSNVRDGKLRLVNSLYTDTKHYLKWTKRAVPESGDLLFTREAPAGEVCILPPNIKALIGQRMVLMKVDPKVLDAQFSVFSIYGGAAKQYINDLSIGSTVAHFNMSDIKNIPFLLPDIDEQYEISRHLKNLMIEFDNSVKTEIDGIGLLNELKSNLIANTVTGKIKV